MGRSRRERCCGRFKAANSANGLINRSPGAVRLLERSPYTSGHLPACVTSARSAVYRAFSNTSSHKITNSSSGTFLAPSIARGGGHYSPWALCLEAPKGSDRDLSSREGYKSHLGRRILTNRIA